VLVDAERKGAGKGAGPLERIVAAGDNALANVGDEDDVAIAAITVAELLVGVELADGRRRSRRKAFVEAVLEAVSVETYDLDVARAHSALLAHTRRSGRARGAHDLIIAATARARRREVVSTDQEGFSGLPEVALRGVL
jgi:tRNA(fMet)-specific endonuclease VapC